MNELSKITSNNIIKVNNSNKELSEFKPFQRDIFLFDTHVAGTTHVEGIMDLEPNLNIDQKLDFFREIDNQHDDRAIEIRTTSGEKIGFVPKKDNLIFSRLMDAGKILYGKITKKEIKGKWLKINIDIFLSDI